MPSEVEAKVKVLLSAQWDIERIALIHYDYVGEESARKITDTIYDVLEHLERFPEMGFLLPIPDLAGLGYRGLLCDKRFLSIYRYIEEHVFIYRILDTRSDYQNLLSHVVASLK